ncbi:MAG: glycosyltransferase [Clostridiales Family XIII bacterium]|jgi:glycosyltransferase involved in cell wall biosynthesis|nr:glycosyltransferase [Clostridiales Family XIII bacterium]
MTEQTPLISIIIPVYNGEKYLSRCIDSVLQQSIGYEHLEIALFNDGSSDGSNRIISEYVKKFPSVVFGYLHENIGVAKTRNEAISLVHGKYVMFIDQDDFIDKDYCQTYFSEIDKTGLDMVMGGYKRPNSAGKIIKKVCFENTRPARFLLTAPWARIINTEALRESGALFFDNSVGEDAVFCVKILASTDKIKCIQNTGYNWYYNEKSVSNTTQKRLTKSTSDSIIFLFRELYEIDRAGKFENPLYEWFIVRAAIFYFLWSGRNSTYREFMDSFKSIFPEVERCYPKFLKNRNFLLKPKGEKWFPYLALLGFLVFYKLRLLKVFARFYCIGKVS